jgi:hypothetical protein
MTDFALMVASGYAPCVAMTKVFGLLGYLAALSGIDAAAALTR